MMLFCTKVLKLCFCLWLYFVDLVRVWRKLKYNCIWFGQNSDEMFTNAMFHFLEKSGTFLLDCFNAFIILLCAVYLKEIWLADIVVYLPFEFRCMKRSMPWTRNWRGKWRNCSRILPTRRQSWNEWSAVRSPRCHRVCLTLRHQREEWLLRCLWGFFSAKSTFEHISALLLFWRWQKSKQT